MYGLNVAVVGGGLGGLATALALRNAGHHPVVYEQTPEFRPVGAGISLWPNGVKVLNLLGLGEQLATLSGQMEKMAYADASGDPLTMFSLAPVYDTVGQRAWPVARAALQDLLVRAVGPERIRLGTRAVAVDSDAEAARVCFDDGSRVRADLVVAADGTHSILREWVVGRPVPGTYVGYVNYNTITACDDRICPPHTWLTWVGDGQRASVMPVGGDSLYTFFDVPAPLEVANAAERPAPIDELRKAFAGWAPAVQHLLGGLDAGRVNRVLIYDLPTLPTWHRGRVVLIGDAGHAMSPDLGQGGCQALEDALVLVHYLTSTNRSVPDALARYQQERLPRTAEIVRRARNRAALIHGSDPPATQAWYRSLRHETGEDIIAGLVESVASGPCR
ncbi:MAG TPA: FAD-dependent urate hydroxylase HpxO [Acidimicrobiales bacterium]